MNATHYTFEGFKIEQLRAIYAEARGMCIGAGKFTSIEHFNNHVKHFVDFDQSKIGVARNYCRVALNQVARMYAINNSQEATEETRMWDSFEGGHISWDHTKANEITNAIVNAARANVA